MSRWWEATREGVAQRGLRYVLASVVTAVLAPCLVWLWQRAGWGPLEANLAAWAASTPAGFVVMTQVVWQRGRRLEVSDFGVFVAIAAGYLVATTAAVSVVSLWSPRAAPLANMAGNGTMWVCRFAILERLWKPR